MKFGQQIDKIHIFLKAVRMGPTCSPPGSVLKLISLPFTRKEFFSHKYGGPRCCKGLGLDMILCPQLSIRLQSPSMNNLLIEFEAENHWKEITLLPPQHFQGSCSHFVADNHSHISTDFIQTGFYRDSVALNLYLRIFQALRGVTDSDPVKYSK